jgi:BMFP domain-containing protein YqiC
MFDPKFFDELSAKISQIIAASPAKDIEKNVKTMMTSMFSKMDLVTREEFDVQRKVLERTREKLDAIEAQLAKMSPGPTTAMPTGSASDSDPGA